MTSPDDIDALLNSIDDGVEAPTPAELDALVASLADRDGIAPLVEAVLAAPLDWQADDPEALGLRGFDLTAATAEWWDFSPGKIRMYLDDRQPIRLWCTALQIVHEDASPALAERIWVALEQAFHQTVAHISGIEGRPIGVWAWDEPDAPDDHNGALVAEWQREDVRIRLTAEDDPDIDLHILALQLEVHAGSVSGVER